MGKARVRHGRAGGSGFASKSSRKAGAVMPLRSAAHGLSTGIGNEDRTGLTLYNEIENSAIQVESKVLINNREPAARRCGHRLVRAVTGRDVDLGGVPSKNKMPIGVEPDADSSAESGGSPQIAGKCHRYGRTPRVIFGDDEALQSLMTPSSLPVARIVPSGENAAGRTRASCPLRIRSSWAVTGSQTRTVSVGAGRGEREAVGAEGQAEDLGRMSRAGWPATRPSATSHNVTFPCVMRRGQASGRPARRPGRRPGPAAGQTAKGWPVAASQSRMVLSRRR